MLTVTDKTKCSGCGACANKCPKTCITMASDGEGFLYPAVDFVLCVKCGICLKACPVLNNAPQNKVEKVYAAAAKDGDLLKKSSSGGMFSLLADYILDKGGIVFGAAFDEKWKVHHRFVDTKKDLDLIRRSKYVQSEIGNTFLQVKDFLNKGRYVLFAGTSCQIAGLKNYLSKNYENLYTADLICHGVPSPRIWQIFLEQNTKNKDNIIGINFRFSRGWKYFFLILFMESKKTLPNFNLFRQITLGLPDGKIKGLLYEKYLYLSFFSGFLRNLFLRPVCHACPFRGQEKYADFTMADFWGVQKIRPEMYDKNGVSLLMLNSQKAMGIFEEIKQNMKYEELGLEEAVKYNLMFYKSVKPHHKRGEFFKNFETEPLDKLVKRLTYKPFIIKAFNFIKRKICF